MTAERLLSPTLARQLAITKQRLAGPRPASNADGLLGLVRELGCLQLDPISVVAPSHLLVLHSRLGRYDPATLDTLLWGDRRLFEYWAHCASIVLTEDYPLYRGRMAAAGTGTSGWAERNRAWLAENVALRQHILDELGRRGPLLSQEIEDVSVSAWESTGWSSGRNVTRMLDTLWMAGEIMVAGRRRAGGQKLWDLAERCLPAWTPRDVLPERDSVRRAAQRSLRALGVARPAHIRRHFIRERYPDLPSVLAELEDEGSIVRVRVGEPGAPWPGHWLVHAADLPLLDALEDGAWQPRTTLLSPFDNLLCDRARSLELFGFEFHLEIYTPKAKRRWGYYVLPILHGDRLIGRIDPALDRATGTLTLNAVMAEPDAPRNQRTARAVRRAITDLASVIGARDIACAGPEPPPWQLTLE
jgi:uncharacterized protein YcaQ